MFYLKPNKSIYRTTHRSLLFGRIHFWLNHNAPRTQCEPNVKRYNGYSKRAKHHCVVNNKRHTELNALSVLAKQLAKVAESYIATKI